MPFTLENAKGSAVTPDPLVFSTANTLLYLVAFILIPVAGCRSSNVMDIKALGAASDGSALATAVVQGAIDKCSQDGGGTVRFPAGRYLIGTIQIKQNVKLLLDKQAVLLGSLNRADYQTIDPFTDAVGSVRGQALIVAVDARNIGVQGEGTIDGQGKLLAAAQKSAGGLPAKPFLMRLVNCDNASIKGIQLRNSAAWTLHLSQCRDVSVDGISITSKGLANNDGIDIDSSQRVTISNCSIDTGDDAVCMKSTSAQSCRDISVTACTLKSSCAGVKVGTESYGDFEHIRIDHCSIGRAGLGGIKLFSVDGAHLRDVAISDVQMNQVRVPIMIRLGARLKTFRDGDQAKPVGTLQDVTIKNIDARNASQLGILISGIPGHSVEGIQLESIRIELPGGSSAKAFPALSEKETAYPEVSMFGSTMPAYGVYARHVRGLEIKNLNLILARPDARAASNCVDVTDKDFTDWNVPVPSD